MPTLTTAATKWAGKAPEMRKGVMNASNQKVEWLKKFCAFAGAEVPDCASRFAGSADEFEKGTKFAVANWDTLTAGKFTPDHYKDGFKKHLP